MAEIRVNTTGTLKLFDADDSHSAGIAAGTITADATLMTLNTADIDISVPIDVTGASTITTADNTDTLTLTSTDADASVGPNINMFRNSGSVAANDYLGTIAFSGKDDAGNIHDYVIFETQAETVTNGGEDGSLYISSFIDGSSVARLSFDKTEAVFNDGSVDLDFRVESNGNANMLHVSGGNDVVGIGAEGDLGTGLHIKTSDSGASVNASHDELVIEANGNSGISILSSTSNAGAICFGDSDNN